MKRIFFLLFLVCLLPVPAFSALTDTDLDKIRLIVNDSEKRMSAKIKSEIATSEKNIKEYVDIRISGVEKQVSLLANVMYALIALIVAAVAIPQLIMGARSRRESSLEKQVARLTEEMEILKQRYVLKP